MASSESRISPPVNVSTIAATSSAAPAARNASRAAPRRRIAAHAARSAPRRSAAMTRPRGKDSTAPSTTTTAQAASRTRTAIAVRRLIPRTKPCDRAPRRVPTCGARRSDRQAARRPRPKTSSSAGPRVLIAGPGPRRAGCISGARHGSIAGGASARRGESDGRHRARRGDGVLGGGVERTGDGGTAPAHRPLLGTGRRDIRSPTARRHRARGDPRGDRRLPAAAAWPPDRYRPDPPRSFTAGSGRPGRCSVPGGATVLQGITVAELAPDGRMRRAVDFWGLSRRGRRRASTPKGCLPAASC